MSGWLHRLENIDLENKTAICRNCGGVDIRIKNNTQRPRCMVVYKEEKKKYSVYKYRDRHPGRPDKCDVCGSGERICWDHDHQTGEHRGWLCSKCNTVLGFVSDDTSILKKLIDYLEQ